MPQPAAIKLAGDEHALLTSWGLHLRNGGSTLAISHDGLGTVVNTYKTEEYVWYSDQAGGGEPWRCSTTYAGRSIHGFSTSRGVQTVNDLIESIRKVRAACPA